ncbi:MAG: DNA polymerase III subunit beta [Desulfobacterales bacterium]|nr:DNA polymerase III subunit beta [Desulfobacterales bacterium]MDD4071244.1 DNA polymerase III subunit beta [Desulfobacterales bacterium]MDD4393268.1 DNA polymerase III subunit beta [Desulfobacterales bacterium]
MKFTINKRDVLDVLSKVQGLTGRKTNLAITANVLIQTRDSGILISATDLETGFEGFFAATIETEGVIAINARKFYEIVRDFPNSDIMIHEKENRWIEIKNNTVEYHIVGMSSDDFPDIPVFDDVEFFDIESAVLKKMFEKTLLSTVADDSRAHVIGVYMERITKEGAGVFRIVSTDGNRLTLVDHVLEADIRMPDGPGVIVPKKGVQEVHKFLDSEGTVRIGFKHNHFILKKESEIISIRLLEGDFPEYSAIVVKRDGNVISINRQMFLMMLKRMSILASDTYKGVIFNFRENSLEITSINPELGESKEDMAIEFSGEPIEVAFNPKYFIDTLNVIDSENVIVTIIDAEKPCVIEEEKNNHYLSIIMPMRI